MKLPPPRRFIITAGPTLEPIDEVRRLTNFSTGALGTLLANSLVAAGHDVLLLRSTAATAPPPVFAARTLQFSTTQDLGWLLHQAATEDAIVVLHAAAVGDFACAGVHRRDAAGAMVPVAGRKFPTLDGELWMQLRPAPKLLPGLRDLFPNARIVGWKYEADGDRADALARGRAQLASARTDACVVNGPAHGPGFTVLRPREEDVPLPDGEALAGWLGSWG